MSKLFETQLLTPDGTLFNGSAKGVKVPGITGTFQVLYNHAPLVTALAVGEISIQQEDGTELHFAVSGGFAEVNNNQCTILAEKAERSDLIPADDVRKERDQLKEKLSRITQNREETEHELQIAENRLKVADS